MMKLQMAAASALAALTGGSTNRFFTDFHEADARRRRNAGDFNPGRLKRGQSVKTYRPNGKRECARRVRQMAARAQ